MELQLTKKQELFIRSLAIPTRRKHTDCCLVEGIRAFLTFATSAHELQELYVSQKALTQYQNELTNFSPRIITEAGMSRISAATSPSGILAIFKITENTAPLSSGLVCARLQDPGNVGTLIRSAAATGKKTIILVESVDPWSPKVIQASAGTIAHMNIVTLSWQELYEFSNRPPLYALVIHGGAIPSSTHTDGLLVVGNEAQGIPIDWIEHCDAKITLPMPGNIESLNAAVAGSIALYLTLLPLSSS